MLPIHFTIEEGGFDHAQALHTPAGGDHLVDQTAFNGRTGMVSGGIIDEHFLADSVLIFAFEDEMVLREVNPCLRELRDDFSRVSGDLGPWDFAPLARDVADFNSDVILLSYVPTV